MKKAKIFLAVGFASVGLTATLVAAPVSARQLPNPTNLRQQGGIDMVQACKEQYGDTGGAYDSVKVGNDVMSWKCVWKYGLAKKELGIDLDRYCGKRWANSKAYYSSFNNPYSWGCYK